MPPIPANLPIIFIVGGPGSGKGTQCDKMKAKYKLTHLSSGDLLRDEVKSGSELGKEMEAIMKAGRLVPLEKVLQLLKNAMEKAMTSETKGFLIDGYPREVEQGKRFEADIAPCAKVIYFEASEDTLVKRCMHRGLTSGRSDDNEETIRNRLRTFFEHTRPVVDYYRKKGKLAEISGEGTIDDIFVKVCAELDPVFNATES